MNFTEKIMPVISILLDNFGIKFIEKNLQELRQFTLISFKTGITLMFFGGYLASVSFAADVPPIEDVVSRLQQTYEKTEDFKADFIQETTIKAIKKTEVEEGVVFFKNPRNMLWNYAKPKAKQLVINSKKVWLYLPQEKVAYTQDAGYIFKSRVLIKFLTGLGNLKDDFTVAYAKSGALDKNENFRLVLTPREKNTTYNALHITVDKDIFYILQVNFNDTFGNSNALRFSNIVINSGIAANIFQFKPPAGVNILKMQ